MIVDVKVIKEKMKERGYVHDGQFDGWTDSLVDAMEEVYSLETELRKAFENDNV